MWTILSINSEYKGFSHFLIHLIDEVCQDRHEGDLTHVNNPCSGLSKTKFWSEAFLRVNKLGEIICSKGKCSHFTVCVCKWNGQWEGKLAAWQRPRLSFLKSEELKDWGGREAARSSSWAVHCHRLTTHPTRDKINCDVSRVQCQGSKLSVCCYPVGEQAEEKRNAGLERVLREIMAPTLVSRSSRSNTPGDQQCALHFRSVHLVFLCIQKVIRKR